MYQSPVKVKCDEFIYTFMYYFNYHFPIVKSWKPLYSKQYIVKCKIEKLFKTNNYAKHRFKALKHDLKEKNNELFCMNEILFEKGTLW